MNKMTQVVVFKLSVLSTLLLCVTANSYASDIEIYKAPTANDGHARIMLTLDRSTMMHQSTDNSGGGTPISDDFGSRLCTSGKSIAGTARSVLIPNTSRSYSYTPYYCDIPKTDVDNSNNLTQYNKPKILAGCELISSTTYRCYDRFTMLKKSLIDVVTNPNLGENISIGMSFFPPLVNADGTDKIQTPLSLTSSTSTTIGGREQLVSLIASVPFSQVNAGEKAASIVKAYGGGTNTLIKPVIGQVDQCSGYGAYSLTAGQPTQEEIEAGRLLLNDILKSSAQIPQGTQTTQTPCPDKGSGTSASSGLAWGCLMNAANLLLNNKSKISVPVKSAAVSFGSAFSFAGMPAYSENVTPETIRQYIQSIWRQSDSAILLDKQNAAIAGIMGNGGYYSADNSADVSDSILKFISTVLKVDIPYLTTGSPTIPQDPLQKILVQNYAYYPQFKPTPGKDYQLWTGNVKKYTVNSSGHMVDKYSTQITDNLGLLVDNYDLWSPSVDATLPVDEPETTVGSVNFALMGGAKSKLALRTTLNADNVAVINRKLLTNRQVDSNGVTSESSTLQTIDLNYLNSADPDRGYLISLLGYKVDAANPSSITTTSLTSAPELRQLGAVMHSSPLLFSNKGKMVYDSTTKKLSTTNREDYILYATTQGLLHIVKAGSSDTDTNGGREVFAFVPHEMIKNQKQAFLSSDSTSGGTANLFYGIDAPWTAYSEYVVDSLGNLTVGNGKNSDVGQQLLYGGLRMGGRSYYALNLQDVSSPSIKFHINPDDQKVYNSAGAQTFSSLQYMGQSWSKPKIAWVRWNGIRKLVMFVGGGYDSGYESDTYDQDSQTTKKGAGVYMFDALNGNLLWWASDNATASSATNATTGVIALKDPNLKYSVVSEIKTADRNNDGLVDHLYFGDLGGQVFRIDLNNSATAIGGFAKRSVRLLNLHKTNGTSPRFYEAPSFSIYKDSASSNLFAVISVGTGNRSLPLKTYPTGTSGRASEALYNIYDKDVTRADLYSTTILNSQNLSLAGSDPLTVLNEINDTNRFANTTLVAPYASSAGWYYKFTAGSALQTEKVLNSPAVINYDLYVSSFDSSKPGFTGPCGGGVQGESKVSLFCMPYGQCAASRSLTAINSIMPLGAGIRDFAIGATDNGETRLITGDPDPEGNPDPDPNPSIIPQQRYSTKVKLIPQRWYERY